MSDDTGNWVTVNPTAPVSVTTDGSTTHTVDITTENTIGYDKDPDGTQSRPSAVNRVVVGSPTIDATNKFNMVLDFSV